MKYKIFLILLIIFCISFVNAQSVITVNYDDFTSGNTINQTLWRNTTFVNQTGGMARIGDGGGPFLNASLNSTFNFKPLFISDINISTGLDGITGTNNLNYQIYIQNNTGRIMVFNNTVQAGGDTKNNVVFYINTTNGLKTYHNGTINQTFSDINLNNLGNIWKIVYEIRKFGGAASGEVLYVDNLNYTFIPYLLNASYPLNNSFVTSKNINFTYNSTGNVIGKTNITFVNSSIYVWNFNNTLRNVTTQTITGKYNFTNFSISNLGVGTFVWNFLTCFSEGVCSFGENKTFVNGVINNSDIFNATSALGNTEGFMSNITLAEGLSLSSANLIYNNVSYSATIIGSGTNLLLSKSITISNVGNNQWYWALEFLQGGAHNISYHIQSVSTLEVDNCTINSNKLLNFTLNDEDSRTRINGTIELIVDFFNSGRTIKLLTFNRSYSLSENVPSALVCFNINQSYSADYEAKYYGNSSYSIEYKFVRALNFSNNTALQNIALYDLLDSRATPFTIILQAADISLIPNTIIDVQREYVPINQYISIESPITDTSGTTIAHLVAKEVYYNFIVSQNGSIIATFNRYLVACQNEVTGDCRINLNLIQATTTLEDFENFGNIQANFIWGANNRTLYFTFATTDNLNHIIAWNVTRFDNYGNTSICMNSVTASLGTFSCTVPNSFGNNSISAKIYSDGSIVGEQIFSFAQPPSQIFGGTRIILGILMYGTLAMLMIGHPVMIVLGSILGMGFASMFRLVDGGSLLGNTSIILWFIIAGIIVVHYMRNRT